MEPESCTNLETYALAESFGHLVYPRLKAMKDAAGARSFQKTFPISLKATLTILTMFFLLITRLMAVHPTNRGLYSGRLSVVSE